MKIIGRNDEQNELKSCLKSFKTEFVVIYGRRRIGKTFLIRNFFDQRFSFYTSGVNNKSNSVQLKNFNNALNEYGFETNTLYPIPLLPITTLLLVTSSIIPFI